MSEYLSGLEKKTQGQKRRVVCSECGKVFVTKLLLPDCPKCYSIDIEDARVCV